MAEYAALIGIDWSDKKHDICLTDPATGRRESSALRHSHEAIDEWAAALHGRFGGKPVAVCLGQSRGPLIYALLKYDFITLYPVAPSTLAKYREAVAPQGRPARRRLPSPSCSRATASTCAPGAPTTSRRAPCATWSSTAAGWSRIAPGSATG